MTIQEKKIEMGMKNYALFLTIAPGASKETYQVVSSTYKRKLEECNGSVMEAFKKTLSTFAND